MNQLPPIGVQSHAPAILPAVSHSPHQTRRTVRIHRRMMAAVLVSPGRFEIREVDLPKPGPRQVRVRLEGCGACESDLSPWDERHGFDFPLLPGAPGHEGWGRIDAVGSEVAGLEPGERVGFLSRRAFAQYDLADSNALVRLPESLEERPFPTEPLAGAMNVFRRSLIEPGNTVAIVGIGFLGALLTQLAALAEATVIAIGRRPYALRIAEEFGALHTLAVENPENRADAIESVRQLTGGALCDIVIEATGTPQPLNLAAELTRGRGRLVVAGSHRDAPRQIDMRLWNERGLDVINAHEQSPAIFLEGMREAVNTVKSGLLTPARLYTDRLPLEQIGVALQLCTERPAGFMKALLQMS